MYVSQLLMSYYCIPIHWALTQSNSRSAVWSGAVFFHGAQRWLCSQRVGTPNLLLVLLCLHECAVDCDTAAAHRGCMETTDSSPDTDRQHKVAQVQEEVTVVLQGDTREKITGENTHFVLMKNMMRKMKCLLAWIGCALFYVPVEL